MKPELTINVSGICEKLRNLNEDAHNNSFYQFLADRLEKHETVIPLGFIMAYRLALYDLSVGVNGYTGEKINNSLVGMPEQVYMLLDHLLISVARNVCPVEFFKEIEEAEKEITKKTEKDVQFS